MAPPVRCQCACAHTPMLAAPSCCVACGVAMVNRLAPMAQWFASARGGVCVCVCVRVTGSWRSRHPAVV